MRQHLAIGGSTLIFEGSSSTALYILPVDSWQHVNTAAASKSKMCEKFLAFIYVLPSTYFFPLGASRPILEQLRTYILMQVWHSIITICIVDFLQAGCLLDCKTTVILGTMYGRVRLLYVAPLTTYPAHSTRTCAAATLLLASHTGPTVRGETWKRRHCEKGSIL